MLIEYGVWVARLAVAVVFGLSAWGKWVDRNSAQQAVTDFGIPLRWAPVVAGALPVVEVVIAVGVLPPWTAAVAASAAVVVLMAFTVAVVRLLRRGKRPVCSCFGAMSTTPIGWRTVARNGVLILVAVGAAVGSFVYPRVPLGLSVDRIVGTTVVAVLVAVLIWLIGAVRALRRRVDEQALSSLGAEGLPVGAVAPEFELLDTRGGRAGLEALQRGGRQVLLVFVHPACELCAALARELPRWRARTADALSIAVIGNGDVDEHAAWGRDQGLGDIPVLVQQGNEAALRYRVRGTPSGVLIGADGRIAAPVARGAMAIRDLIGRAKAVARQ
ncbi:MauE/DoxX family redox-associated membrane protein [Nocardia transvalensis]|uniref:MauE/DoxX family redox-associated membrane protein n=1 Tax=Nocardia transvalensis TaxID=37333 RepID=UPI00189468C2|nr:MauE/DoxX family redox-associated membrane protein [Nocardia transvalensis]MBF6328618.1 redoxin domain-containing protein [Nocardia transvalensis]